MCSIIGSIIFNVACSVDTFREFRAWAKADDCRKSCWIGGELIRKGTPPAVLVAYVDENHEEARRHAAYFVAIVARCCGLNKYPCREVVCYN